MTNLLLLFSTIATGSIRVIVYLFLIFRLLKAKKPNKYNIITAVLGITILSIIEISDFYHILLETIWLVICVNYFQTIDTRLCLFIGIFYEIAISFWQFLIAAWLGVFFHSSTFLNNNTKNGQIAIWLLHILLIAFLQYLWKHPIRIKKEISIIILIGFLSVITLSQQTILPIADDTLDMWTILAVILMMSILVFNMNQQYQIEKELVKLKSEQAELLERDYTTLNHAYTINAKLFHDFHNHIGVLRCLLSYRKLDEALQYLDELQAPIQEMTNTIWTGDKTVDYLINSKAVTAKTHHIFYQVQVEFPHHTNLQSVDLCAILGNLLDNALEAAQQVPENKERFIRLTIRRINQMVIIKVENSFISSPIQQNGIRKTSKVEDGLHGWGLKSAQTAAEKYDGMIQTSYTNNTFQAVVTLSYNISPITNSLNR